ncbi:Probable myosin-binding protein 6 [Linum grandiflorum]
METKNPRMGAQRTFKGFVEEELGRIPHFVIYALLEWFLILVLLVDAFLSFFANEYAKFFELRIPCLLCTRINHVFLRKHRDLYLNDTMCDSHRKRVSSLAYCHIHKKLSDIRTMCEACLLSFATEKESGSDTYKSLVGILHKDIELFFDDNDHHDDMQYPLPAGKRDDVVVPAEKSHVHRCSCCGGPLKGGKSKGKNAASTQAPTPSPRASAPLRHLDLPPTRYSDLKFPDNDSEIDESRKEVRGGGATGVSYDEMNEERTPSFLRGQNKFFGIPLTDSATTTPRWAIRCPKKSALDKAEYASDAAESGCESATAEQDGKQVRLDRKSLMDLYMELDEERNASAVAANNAMAMITRLQAEKAAVQMEALQYQRMMEEEAEYDEEAIQLLRDELRKKDRHIKHLQNEIEAYRIKYGDLTEDGFVMDDEEDYLEMDERSEFATPTYISTEGPNYRERSHSFNSNGSSSFLSRSASGRERSDKNQSDNIGGGEGTKSSSKFGGLRRLKHLEKKKQQGSSSDDETEQEMRMNARNELNHLRARVRTVEEEDDFFRDDELFVEVDNGSEKRSDD